MSGDLAAQVDEETWELVKAGELATIGSWPMPGGWMQQAAAVVDVTRLIMQENKNEALQWQLKTSLSR